MPRHHDHGDGHDNDSNGHDDDTGPTVPIHQRHDHGDGDDYDGNGHDDDTGLNITMIIMIRMLITKMIMTMLMMHTDPITPADHHHDHNSGIVLPS